MGLHDASNTPVKFSYLALILIQNVHLHHHWGCPYVEGGHETCAGFEMLSGARTLDNLRER